MIHKFTPSQTKILLALATYKFLTVSQMLHLGILAHRSSISRNLIALRKEGSTFIDRIVFSYHPKKGKLGDMYYLKPKGKRALIEGQLMEESKIKLPIGRSSMFYKDYFHRKHTIDFQMSLYQRLQGSEVELLFFDTYFDKLGNNRKDKNLKAQTKIDLRNDRYLIADAVFMLQTEERDYLYCLEICNGKDTKRIVRQTKQYLEALALGSASDKYKHNKAVRILSVFEHESIKEAVLKRISKDAAFDKVERNFMFKSLEEVMGGKVLEGWCNGKWRVQKLF